MKQQIFRLFANLRFAIFILLLIGFCSIAGTIIEQNQPIEMYKINYPLSHPVFGFLSWNRIMKLGLDHVYQSWWFVSLIFFFGLSLILCSFLQQVPSLQIARRCQFFRKITKFCSLKSSTILNCSDLNKVVKRTKDSHYSLFQQKNAVYCYKGLMGRIAPLVVHFSMILTLSGVVFGALLGFKAQEAVPTSENFHIQNVLNNGPLTQIPNSTIRVNSFWLIYTKQKTISQFYSDLSILNKKGTEIVQKTIYVNCPLFYKNVYYYQTDWNLLGLRFYNSKSELIEYPLIALPESRNKIWLTWISNNSPLTKGLVAIVDNLEGYCSIYNEEGQFLGNAELNEQIDFFEFTPFSQIIISTGLQIKTDPGLLIIYCGFFFLMSSTLLSYITYSQIWIVQKDTQTFVGGTTNRAFFEFELEFFKITYGR